MTLNQAMRPALASTSRAAQRLRARRLKVSQINLVATGRHTALGTFRGNVEDLSLYGMAIRLDNLGANAGMILVGDRLDDLAVDFTSTAVFRGSAVVRRVVEDNGATQLGIEFENGGVDFVELYRRSTRESFEDRWKQLQVGHDETAISKDFKEWVIDIRTYLERTRDFLVAEERSLESADELTRAETLQEYLAVVAPQVINRMNRASTYLLTLCTSLSEDDQTRWRALARTHLYHLFAESPNKTRATEKPLGYAGDYEVMNMFYRPHAEGASAFGKTLNLYAAQEAAAQANMNRIDYLKKHLHSAALSARPRKRARIASIGCGPSREIGSFLESSPELGPRLDVALIDQDDKCIAYCERTLAPLANKTGARLEFIRESIRRLIAGRRLSMALGERDFIYSAGLFDYLNDRSFVALLSVLYEALEPGGLLAVGNVAINNPSRGFMEFCLEWFLHHRSEKDLVRLAQGLTPEPRHVDIDSEPSGVNLFLLIRK